MKSLHTLIKLAQQRVRQQRMRLLKVEAQMATLEVEKRQYEEELALEQSHAHQSAEGAALFGRYAMAMREKIGDVILRIEAAQVQYLQEQKRLQGLFQEAKVLEIVDDRIAEEAQYTREKMEQREQEDLYAARLRFK